MDTNIIITAITSCFTTAIICYFLAKRYMRPINEVVEVKEVVRLPSECQTYSIDFIIDEHELMRNPHAVENVTQRYIHDAKIRLMYDIPDNIFVLFKQQDFRTGNDKYHMELTVLPPHKH